MTTREDVDRLIRTQEAAISGARHDLQQLMGRLEGAGPEATRDALLEAVPQIATRWGDAAAAAAAEWYERVRPTSLGSYTATTAPAIHPDRAAQTVRRLAGALWDDSPDRARLTDVIAMNVGGWIRDQGRATIARSTDRDPADVAWARVPRGATTCPWCTKLASRGWDYHSRSSAAAGSHRDCDCQIVPEWSDDPAIAGYDPDTLYSQYLRDEEEAAEKARRKAATTQETDSPTGDA